MADSQSIESKMYQETDYTLHRRAEKCIAQSYLTNSKRPQSLIMGVYPTHLVRGKGCFVWDAQGKKYVDFITGLGTNLLGYANDTVSSAVREAIDLGNLYSLASPFELEAAETLKGIFQFVDCWKFTKTGSDACSAAVRVARAATGRETVLSEGYHGTDDNFVSLTPPHLGTLDPDRLGFAKLSLDAIDRSVAAVIVEPIMTDFSAERIKWLHDLREKCTDTGTLLIFDEIVTGFRFPKMCVSRYIGIDPDLICLGKAMANGLPLAAVGGKYAVMNCGEYFISSTYASCSDAFAACKAVCNLLQKSFRIDELWKEGEIFLKEFNDLWPEKITIEGYPTRGIFRGDEDIRALFFQESCYAGMLFGPSFWYNFPLAKIGLDLIPTLREIMDKIRRGGAKLRGEKFRSPFAQKVREQ